MKFDGNRLSMEEIRALVDLGDNPSISEMSAIGLESNGDGGWDVVNFELFEKARKTRTIFLDSSDLGLIGNLMTRRKTGKSE